MITCKIFIENIQIFSTTPQMFNEMCDYTWLMYYGVILQVGTEYWWELSNSKLCIKHIKNVCKYLPT